MQPRGLSRAGATRWQGLILCSILVLACFAQAPAVARDSNSTANSAFPATIGGLIGATRDALGFGPSRPTYKRTRFVMELGKRTKYQVFALSRPNRVVIEVPNVPMRLPTVPAPTKGTSQLITGIRSGKDQRDKFRIIINVAAPVVIENKRLETAQGSGNWHRLSLDVVPVTTRSRAEIKRSLRRRLGSLGGFGLQPPTPRPAETPSDLRARSFKPVIVIDPGHGGHDSGAKKFGVQEKDVVLAFSLMLRDKLRKTGRYRVLMTRSTDVFVSLGGRRQFADKHKAALFIAVHADYASTNARGATIYSLRERTARRLKSRAKRRAAKTALGKQEKKALLASAAGIGIVRDILSDLAEREIEVTKRRTDLFSQTVVREMGQTTLMRNQPHKTAGFKVIKTAQMPSVLIELAYVSNRRDVRQLTSETWRNKVSTSIVRAVDDYFSRNISRVPM